MRDPDLARRLPEAGLEEKEIPFILVLALDGRLVGIKDTRTQEGKKKFARRYQVPQGVKKTSGVAANLLWDTAEYVLGLDTKGKPQRVAEQVAAFRQRVDHLAQRVPDDAGLIAVQLFLTGQPLVDAQSQPQWAEIAETNPIMSFRLKDDIDLVCQRPGVIGAVSAAGPDEEAPGATSVCLITGELAEPERLHSSIKGVWGAQVAGANIVSFNLDAFRSFGKEQGANAPVSAPAAFAYTTALNSLLAKGSRQRMQVGDASTVFWAQSGQDSDFEDAFAAYINEPYDDPDAHTEQVRTLLTSIHNGQFAGAVDDRRFYVLGLAPNAARVSIRFWYSDELSKTAERIAQWFDDIQVVHADFEPEYLPLRRLLASACLPTREKPFGDIDKLPSAIAGDLLRCIFSGAEIPSLLLNSVLMRCRAEQARKDDKTGKPVRNVSYARAALLRASINRYRQIHQPQLRRIPMSLDSDLTDQPYVLGRLFAVYERTQEVAAERDLNKTLRDAYFGAAMSTPASVFPRLIHLNQIHLRDVKRSQPRYGRYIDKLILSINDKINPREGYPRVLALHDQAQFALGYYHQRQDFFTKADANKAAAASAAEPNESTQGD
jgi:CRISPR-associated protein Csd1